MGGDRFGARQVAVCLASGPTDSGRVCCLRSKDVMGAAAKLRVLKSAADAEKLVAMMEPLLAQAAAELQALVDRVERVDALKAEILLRFGEDAKSGEIQELLHEVAKFCAAFAAAASASTLESKAAVATSHAAAEAAVASSAAAAPLESAMADIQQGNFRRRATSISRMSVSKD